MLQFREHSEPVTKEIDIAGEKITLQIRRPTFEERVRDSAAVHRQFLDSFSEGFAEQVDVKLSAIVGWDVIHDGKPLPCSLHTIKLLCTEYGCVDALLVAVNSVWQLPTIEALKKKSAEIVQATDSVPSESGTSTGANL